GLRRKTQKPLTEVVKFGHFFVLNCTTNSSSSCDIQERSSQKYDYNDFSPTWKTFTFIVVYWSLRASCVVTCNNESNSWETIVTVYQPPEKIELGLVPEMEVGKHPHPEPHRDLAEGEEQLLVKTFEDHTHPEAGTVVVNHHIIAQKDDHSKTITCQTSLDLGPKGPLLENTSHSISLWILGEILSIAPVLIYFT
ncbi:hypothetical protein E2320_016634, partial [Naja naja]